MTPECESGNCPADATYRVTNEEGTRLLCPDCTDWVRSRRQVQVRRRSLI